MIGRLCRSNSSSSSGPQGRAIAPVAMAAFDMIAGACAKPYEFRHTAFGRHHSNAKCAGLRSYRFCIVQANEEPARLLARVTLRGHVEEVVGPEAASAAGLHRLLHGVVRTRHRPSPLPS